MRIRFAVAILLAAFTACTNRPREARLPQQKPVRTAAVPAPPPPPPPRNDTGNGYVHPILRSVRPAPPIDAMRNPDIPPHVLQSVAPKYTSEARKQRIEGIVIVETIIEKDGRVMAARVLKPLPGGLAKAAIEAVRQYRFDPAIQQGKPVRALYNVVVRFKLPK